MIIAGGTIISSLQNDRMTKAFDAGKVTAFSVLLTALALCLRAIPYGLGAGSVDAWLNNYVALHYASRHMSWLHCMWGIGASIGPYIMGSVLTGGQTWNMGYRYIALLQTGLPALLLISLPLWNKQPGGHGSPDEDIKAPPLSLKTGYQRCRIFCTALLSRESPVIISRVRIISANSAALTQSGSPCAIIRGKLDKGS